MSILDTWAIGLICIVAVIYFVSSAWPCIRLRNRIILLEKVIEALER
jgi:hypothetical protein